VIVAVDERRLSVQPDAGWDHVHFWLTVLVEHDQRQQQVGAQQELSFFMNT
jgi:hypothetical protein